MGSKGCLPSLLIKKIELSSIFEHLLSDDCSEKDVANQNAFFCYQMKNENYNEWKKIKTLLFLQEHKHSLKTSILKVNCTNILRVLDNKREYLMGLHNT